MREKITKSEAGQQESNDKEQPKAMLTQYQHRDRHFAGTEAGTEIEQCIYCSSKDITKRGTRKKKHGKVQLYFCKNCQKTFTPQKIRGKHYPLRVILDALTFYNLGHNLEDSCRFIREKYGLNLRPATLSDWSREFAELCRYSRLRKLGSQLCPPSQIVQGINLYHRQVYKFRIHQAKLDLLLEEDGRHRRLTPLREFLQAIQRECPHHLFRESQRASQAKAKLNLEQVLIKEKANYATRIANLVL